jgi:pentatricopeptide repeat protein
MSHKNVVSLNAIIAAYAQHGHGKDALILFNWMQQSNMTPNSSTEAIALGAIMVTMS